MTEFNEQKPTLYLIRGVSGAGKSTFAKTLALATNAFWFEADQYFYDQDGNYKFDSSRLSEAHQWCQYEVRVRLSNLNDVIVSNTSTTENEVQTYQDIALQFGANFVSIIVENRNATKTVHEVPEEVLQRQRSRFSVKL